MYRSKIVIELVRLIWTLEKNQTFSFQVATNGLIEIDMIHQNLFGTRLEMKLKTVYNSKVSVACYYKSTSVAILKASVVVELRHSYAHLRCLLWKVTIVTNKFYKPKFKVGIRLIRQRCLFLQLLSWFKCGVSVEQITMGERYTGTGYDPLKGWLTIKKFEG